MGCLTLADQRSDRMCRCRNRIYDQTCLESDQARVQREKRNRKKELRVLADRISTYGRKVHQRYPTGDVVVSERDLAEQLRKHPDIVATALNLLLGEQKVQKAPLRWYWKLNV